MVEVNNVNLCPTSRQVPVTRTIESSITNASITPLIEGTHRISKLILIWQLTFVKYKGTDAHYLVEPNIPMVATLRATREQVCTFNETTRNCVPSGKWNVSRITRDLHRLQIWPRNYPECQVLLRSSSHRVG